MNNPENNPKNNPKNNSEDLSNSSSDEETFIDINELIKSQLKNIYQIQLNNDKLMIKHVGRGSEVPDIIINESFGKKNNLSLYSCVYLENEIEFLKSEKNNDKFLPIIKLIEKVEDKSTIYSLSVKINNFINYNEDVSDFSIYLTYNANSDFLYHTPLEKNINQGNVIEKMLEKIIDLGFNIL